MAKMPMKKEMPPKGMPMKKDMPKPMKPGEHMMPGGAAMHDSMHPTKKKK